jgi:uncharacterized repeat protein (TIGR02059 family)
MNNQNTPLRQYSFLRLFIVGLLLSATLAVSVASRATVVKADAGEAPFGTATQSLQSALSLARDQTCVISNGNALCWGGNSNGVIGNGLSGSTPQSSPSYVVDSAANSSTRLSNVIGIATADNHTCAIIAPLGKVKCWGSAAGNRLGRHDPAANLNFIDPFPGFVKDSYTNGSQLAAADDLQNVTSVVIGTYGSCALISDGTVKCWGQSPGHAGTGVGFVTACTTQPVGNTGCSATTGVPISNVKQISRAGDTACAIFTNQTMQCWGSDGGKYGNGGSGLSSDYPKNVNPDIHGALALGSAEASQCGLYQNSGTVISEVGGTVKCWGQNNAGELGRGIADALPSGVVSVIGITNAISISGHERTYCALLINTTVKCWGSNNAAMMSSGSGVGSFNTPQTMLSNFTLGTVLSGVAAVSVGMSHVCVIMQSNGAVKCSGINNLGQLGDGTVIGKAVGTVVVAGQSCVSDCTGRALTGSGGEFMPPVFSSAAVTTSGSKIALTYEKALSTTNIPLTTSFDVKVGGVTRGVASVAIVGSTVELTLSSPISRTLSVTISYTDPTASNDTVATQDVAGNDAATLTTEIVTNNSTVDLIAPVLVSGAVNTTGTQLTLTYDEALNATTAVPSRFTLTVAGRTKTISTATVSGSTVVLAVGSPVIQSPQSVTIAYSAITANNAITTNLAVQDTAGNDAASFAASAITVTNSSIVANLAPTLLTKETNREGTKIILTYDEPLGTTLPLADKFTVNIGSPGVARTVSTVLRGTDTTTVELTLTGSPITEGQAITVAYVAPASNDATSNAAIQDLQGKDAAAFAAASVANNVDATAPTFVSGGVNSGGSLVLTYSEPLAEPAPAPSAFEVTVNGNTVTVISVTIDGSTVVVVTSPVIGAGDVVTFRYTDPSTGNDANSIQDSAGNDVPSNSNNVAIPSSGNASTVDTSAPTFVSGEVNSGGSLVLTYSEPLAAPAPAPSALEVTINGSPATVVSVTIVGSTIVVVTSPVIGAGDVVSFRYADPSTGNDANAIQDAAGNDVRSSSSVYSLPTSSNTSTQPSATTPSTTVPTTPTTVPTTPTTVPTTPTTVPTTNTVDGDAPTASLSTTETQSIAGKTGKASFSDGSTFDVSKNGNLIPKLFTAYIGTVTGSVKVIYKVGKKTVSTTCSYGKYGSTKPKKVTKSVNGFFPKVFISPKKTCLMPKAAITALNTQLVTISANLKFVRLWPTTGKAKNPESGAAVRPVKRAYSVKIGTAPK